MKVAARFKSVPEDFIVDEVPLYAPSGSGDHLYVRFRKRDRNTMDVVHDFARAWGVPARDIGVAGLKDKLGVTTQTVSVPASAEPRIHETPFAGVEILSAERHTNKLKTGHLGGNAFKIRLRDIAKDRVQEIDRALASIRSEGVPNAFGAQRFGRGSENAKKALSWLLGKDRPPRDVRLRRLLFSALQSHVFNEVLRRRMSHGTWNQALLGDVLRKTDSGGLFVCEDSVIDGGRTRRGELSPTGPMFGPKMVAPRGEVLELENSVLDSELGPSFPFEEASRYGEGTRRALRLMVSDLQAEWEFEKPQESQGLHELGNLCVRFVLPKGAYATTVLEPFIAFDEPATVDQNEA